jgi:soluble lytic murein transglycosylase
MWLMGIFKLAVSALLLAISLNVVALPNDTQETDALFNRARVAYQTKNEVALTDALQQMQAQQYILAPYASYWLMLLQISNPDADMTNERMQAFFNQYADYPFTDRLRGEWLKQLGKRQDWKTLLDEYPRFQRDDVGVKCYVLQARAQVGDVQALVEGKDVWSSASDQPSNCGLLFDAMQKANVLKDDDIWARFRLALQEGKLSLAKNVLLRLSKMESTGATLIDKTYQNPQQVLEKKLLSTKTTLGRELTLFAIDRLARSQIENTVSCWQKMEPSFSTEERQYAWGRIGLWAAKLHYPSAKDYFEYAGKGILDQEQMAWKARSYLRVKDWPKLQVVINDMLPSQQEEAVWRYWKARALKEQKQIPMANALLVPLSHERTYYGLLAEEELGDVLTTSPNIYTPSSEDVIAIKMIPGIQRALELMRFDMRWESRMEWAMAIKDLDDKGLIAVADFASQQEWYDLAISAADKTISLHNYALRYPTPYRALVKEQARDQAIDEAWVYGLTRQESRFVSNAKSGVGAAGLMQLMPATASWVAKRMGIGYSGGMIHQQDTNIKLGTYYLRYTLDLMGGQALMATAAYNAGPGRAKRWGAGDMVEGAIYAETIPIYETRLYVQKVMANAYFYAHRLGTKVMSLKQRLGVVGGDATMVNNVAVPVGSENTMAKSDDIDSKTEQKP